MSQQDSALINKIRQQFDTCPYPKDSLEKSYKENTGFLYVHNLTTPFYLRDRKVTQTADKLILDAGCGSGSKALGLAEANPGAKIVGVDISEESVKLAQQRLQFHGFETAYFHAIGLEELPQLGYKFDYINCDEVLYLLPDPIAGLQAMKSALKEDGILRVNLHSLHGRANIFRAQEIFKMMGLTEDSPGELEIGIVRDAMSALQDRVILKKAVWKNGLNTIDYDDASILANFLLVGDRGFTVPEMFAFLQAAGLEFLSMVHPGSWDLLDLFEEPDNLPVSLSLLLAEASVEDRLYLHELFHPVNRLIDLWCGHPGKTKPYTPVSEWTVADWQNATVYLHPQLNTSAFQIHLVESLTQIQPFEISRHLEVGQSSWIDSTIAACLFPPLLESAQPMESLVNRWLRLHPIHPTTLAPTTREEALELLGQAIVGLEAWGYLLVEREA